MKHETYAVASLFAVIAACSASGGAPTPATGPTDEQPDGEGPVADAGPSNGDGPDLDAQRPLVCGDAGFCETRLPTSDIGLPLSLRSVWVVGSDDVWSVSLEGFILHYDGSTWTTEYKANHELYAVWATPTSVWAGGEAGLLLHRDAAGTWSPVDAGHVAPIHSIYGSGDGDVWFTREDASVDHFDGSTLSHRAIDVHGLKVTIVFGREGFGTYAAGHVPGARPLNGVVEDQPYVFEVSSGTISVFSASLSQRRGFVPISGAVTDSADPEKRIFLIGSEERTRSVYDPLYRGKYCLFGSDNPVAIRSLTSNLSVIAFSFYMYAQRVADRRAPLLAYQEGDIRLAWELGWLATWKENETIASMSSLDMGREFQPGDVFGAHNDSTSTWFVGDGFALKGANP